MTTSTRGAAAVAALTLAAALTGCSANALIWGVDGAQVIGRADEVIEAAASGRDEALACAGSSADFGVQEDWDGVSAGTPRRLGDSEADAAWIVGLELTRDARAGRVFPAEIRLLETGQGLCVADIAWSAVDEGAVD